MIYQIEFSPTSEAELIAAAMFIAREAPLNAQRWYEGIHQAIMSLSEMPSRCSLSRESEAFDMEVRQRVFKSYRIIFTIHGQLVRIHRVIHTARQSLSSPDELSM